MPDEQEQDVTGRQRAERADAERDTAMSLVAAAWEIMTPDQKEKLRDYLVCRQLEEEI